MRVLDFDCESRPLSFLGGGFTTDEITAISCAWVVPETGDVSDQKTWLLGKHRPEKMLEQFVARYNQADMVTGHFIRGFDLPLVNGMLLEYGFAPLGDKLSHDTKNDLRRRKGVSASQENLGQMLYEHLDPDEAEVFWSYLHQKEHMNATLWRRANRLSRSGLRETQRRVEGDVKQHAQMRQRLLDLGWLDKPKVWNSGGPFTGAYVP